MGINRLFLRIYLYSCIFSRLEVNAAAGCALIIHTARHSIHPLDIIFHMSATYYTHLYFLYTVLCLVDAEIKKISLTLLTTRVVSIGLNIRVVFSYGCSNVAH
jgi:hypothetical protein